MVKIISISKTNFAKWPKIVTLATKNENKPLKENTS